MKRELKLYGFDMEDFVIGKKSMTAKGEHPLGEIDLIVDFTKKVDPKVAVISIDYTDYNGIMVQEYHYENYKKYTNALKSKKHEDHYAKAMDYIAKGSDSGVQRGIDMLEEMPGMKNISFFVQNYDTFESFHWT